MEFTITSSPDFHPEQLRGAFLGTTYLGGYRIPAITVHLGPARLRIGGIGAVVTHPTYRHQGVAAALMRDAITYATQRRYALLLLDGITNFYAQFGYVNVLESLTYALALEEVHTHAPSPYIVRPAALDDASALLALHQRHYGSYFGFCKSGKNISCAIASFLQKNPPSWFSPQTMSLVDTFYRSRVVPQPTPFWK